MFFDVARIFLKSGKGGNGHVSFRRELYVPAGGPDGGDGGKGGDIVFEVDPGMNTLENFRNRRKYMAEAGSDGARRRMHGKNGKDLVIKVPPGTIIRDDGSGKIITDMSGEQRRIVLLRGGKGGLGNMHFATASMQAPKFAQPGQDAMELWVRLELRVIADVGLLGFPNVGKSTILSMCSNARPEIANYHFTTINPHLGVVSLKGDRQFVMADIPGLIEGASDGAGLGFQFLRHISRCRALIHVVDAAGSEGRDPIRDVELINKELESYDPSLLKKVSIIAANKLDLLPDGGEEAARLLSERFSKEGIRVLPVSAASNRGLSELLEAAWEALGAAGEETVVYESEFDISSLGRGENMPVTLGNPKPSVFTVEGPKIEKMLGYTNLEAEKGFAFFQRFMIEQGIISDLRKMGMKEGDTIRIYGHEFEYLDTESFDRQQEEDWTYELFHGRPRAVQESAGEDEPG